MQVEVPFPGFVLFKVDNGHVDPNTAHTGPADVVTGVEVPVEEEAISSASSLHQSDQIEQERKKLMHRLCLECNEQASMSRVQ